MLFAKGDRVRCLKDVDGTHTAGLIGIVVSGEVNELGKIPIDFGSSFSGHRCSRRLEHPTGWYVPPDYLVYELDDSEIEPPEDGEWDTSDEDLAVLLGF